MRAGRVIAWLVAGLLYAWALAALALFPGWPPLARWSAVIAGVAVTAGVLWRVPARWRAAVVLGGALGVVVLWQTVRAQTDRAWAAGQECMPRVRLDGDAVEIDNVRAARWRTVTEADIRWETRRYDLRTIRSVDLVLEPFGEWRGLAHVFVTFGFEGGEFVAISIESRREVDEQYSPLLGAFRAYELLYVIGDERDLIGLRSNVRRHDVYLFPMRAQPEDVRALFVSMVMRTEALAGAPEFYNTITASCATELLRHVNHVRDHDIGALDWRLAIPGYADELAWELGLIDGGDTIDAARERFRITPRAAGHDRLDGPQWSQQIRASSPAP